MLRGKWESVFSGRHKDNVPTEIPAVSVMTLHKLLEREVVVTVKDARTIVFSCIREVRFCIDKKTVLLT